MRIVLIYYKIMAVYIYIYKCVMASWGYPSQDRFIFWQVLVVLLVLKDFTQEFDWNIHFGLESAKPRTQ